MDSEIGKTKLNDSYPAALDDGDDIKSIRIDRTNETLIDELALLH